MSWLQPICANEAAREERTGVQRLAPVQVAEKRSVPSLRAGFVHTSVTMEAVTAHNSGQGVIAVV